jgi:tellurite resistance protein
MAMHSGPSALVRSRPIPLASFAAVMGILGLGLDWRLAASSGVVSDRIGEAIVALGGLVFVVLLLRWLRRVRDVPSELAVETNVAITASYLGTLGISLSLLAVAAVPYSRVTALVLWTIAAAGSAALLIYLLGKWIEEGIKDFELTPALLLPVVGNAASVFAAGALGMTGVAWFSFSFALICWLTLTPLITYRLLVVQPRLPRKLAPQLAILVSSPAVLASAWFVLDGNVVDAVMRVLAFKSLFFALLTIRMWKIAWGEPFNVAMWGWTFPAAALAGAFERIALHDPTQLNSGLAISTIAMASVIVALCAAGSLRGWYRQVAMARTAPAA